MHDREKRWNFIKVLLTYVLLYVAIVVGFSFLNVTPESVRELLHGKGVFLVPLFILVQLLVALTPIPDLPFIAAGVLFFEPWAAFVLTWIGMTIGSIINFNISRRLGRRVVQKRYPQTSKWIDKFAGKYGFETVVVARSFTLVTFDLIAYAAGISNMGQKKFAIATVFGILPIALNATLVGLAFISENVFSAGALFSLSVILVVLLGLLAQKYSRWMEKRQVASKA
jgi:uncharacterized membrane protein YdjX (TVP38/TMEM64 family)